MAHVVEMVTALIGCCLVAGGCVCTFRLALGKDCPPAVERLSMALLLVGSLTAAAALAAYALWG